LFPCFATLAAPTPLAVLRRWPVPADLVAAPVKTVRAVLQKASRNHYGDDKLQELLESARSSVALTSAGAERSRELVHLLKRWALVRSQLAEVDAEIERQVLEYPPARALTTIPQLGPVSAATILSELGALDDYVHPRQVLKLAGMNLVEKSSGQLQSRRRQSKRGRPLLRKQLYLLAIRWCKSRGLYRDQYVALVARNGGSKVKAISALARKLVPLLLEVAQSAQPFDQGRWENERRRRAI
jgi:transposase